MGHRTDWFHRARWGAASHYLADFASNTSAITLSPDEWNRQIDAFDVEGLADQLAAARVGFYMLTLGQNSGFFLSPNAAYDRVVGRTPSWCSRRDVMLELALALEKRGIPLLAYLPSGAPAADPFACEKLGWEWGYQGGWPNGWRDELRTGKRLAEFQRNWEAVIREWSLRWGRRVKGWWFDGCYFADEMYRHADAPNFHSFAAAARAGNPDSIVAFNPGILLSPHSDAEDYTAGETNEPEKLECTGRWVTGADGHREQYHVWSYLGKTWGALPLRFTDEEAARLTRRMVDPGGVMMWDVPIEKSGRFPAVAAAQLARLGKALGEADQKQQLRPHAERFVFTQTRPAVRREDGTVTPAVVEVRLENVAARTELLLTHAADAGVGGQFAVDLVTEWTLPRLAAAPALTDMEAALAGVPPRRVAGAELRFAAAGENLLLFARVADHAVRVDPAQPWTGSVVELFGSGAALESAVEAGPAGASQFFLVPAAGNQPAKVLSSGTPKPVPDAEIAGVAVPGGYTLALRLPFRLFPGWRADAGQCRLEVVVTGTPEQAGAVQRRALFNCPSPWSHAAGLSVGKFIG